MKHTNQGDSSKNQTERDQQKKAQNAQNRDRNDSMDQQNKQGEKGHSPKHGNDQSNWQNDRKENKR
jgi:hypothetical protein